MRIIEEKEVIEKFIETLMINDVKHYSDGDKTYYDYVEINEIYKILDTYLRKDKRYDNT